jgi:hypothetical protein
MENHITACRKCGSTTFFVHEPYVWLSEIDDESGVLVAYRPSSEIETVACEECSEEYDPQEFREITFC